MVLGGTLPATGGKKSSSISPGYKPCDAGIFLQDGAIVAPMLWEQPIFFLKKKKLRHTQ